MSMTKTEVQNNVTYIVDILVADLDTRLKKAQESTEVKYQKLASTYQNALDNLKKEWVDNTHVFISALNKGVKGDPKALVYIKYIGEKISARLVEMALNESDLYHDGSKTVFELWLQHYKEDKAMAVPVQQIVPVSQAVASIVPITPVSAPDLSAPQPAVNTPAPSTSVAPTPDAVDPVFAVGTVLKMTPVVDPSADAEVAPDNESASEPPVSVYNRVPTLGDIVATVGNVMNKGNFAVPEGFGLKEVAKALFEQGYTDRDIDIRVLPEGSIILAVVVTG